MINKKEDRISNVYTCLLVALIILQPILELVWFNNGTLPEIAGFTIPTLIRFGMVGVIGVLSLSVLKYNKSNGWLVGYVIVVTVYSICHLVTCRDFHSFVPGNFGYNIVSEIFYIIRMILPIAMMYFVYNSTMTEKFFQRIVVFISVFSSSMIIITNITKTSLGSYSDKTILGNFFDWFLNKGIYTFNDLASKGYFYWSIFSTVLVLIFPFLIYLYIKNNKKRYLVLILAQAVSLYMFGTKATTFSVIIELVIMFGVYLVCSLVKHDIKFSKIQAISLGIILIGACVILPYTPAVSREQFDSNYKVEIDKQTEPIESETTKDFESYVAENYPYFNIKEEFILKSYNYKYDLQFWQELLNELGPSQRMQNRIIEQKMLQRVKEVNNDPLDDFFGIGYSRTSNIYNLERDFLYQYYSLGLLGVCVFLGPYVIIVGAIIVLMLFKFKSHATIENCSLVLGVGLSLFLAYYSGNVLDNLGITILMGAVCGYLMKLNFNKE